MKGLRVQGTKGRCGDQGEKGPGADEGPKGPWADEGSNSIVEGIMGRRRTQG